MTDLRKERGFSTFLGNLGATTSRTLVTAEEYEKYRPLLMTALSRLAHQGYAVPPSDGLELIHDFFIEAWNGLIHRYDESRSKFETYLFAAFVRFARPRIVKTLRWTKELLPPDEIEKAHNAVHGMQRIGQEQAPDVRAMKLAVNSLAPGDQELLWARFAEGLSEREVSQRLGMSRYYFRAASAGALTRLAERLNEPGSINAKDWKIASALWVEGRTVPEIAQSLEITPARVKGVRERLIRLIAGNVSSAVQSRLTHRGSRTMVADTQTKESDCKLWEKLVRNPHGQEVIEAVRNTPERLAKFLDHIEECDACEKISQPAENVEAIYDALGALEEDFTEEDRDVLERSLDARAKDERELEEAVLTALIPSLPRDLQKIVPWLATQVLPKVAASWPDVLTGSASLAERDQVFLNDLRLSFRDPEIAPMNLFRDSWLPAMSHQAEDVRQLELKGALGEELAWRLDLAVIRRSARTIFLAMHAVGMVIESSLRRNGWPQAYLNKGCDLFLGPEITDKRIVATSAKPTVPRTVLINEISGVAGVPIPAAEGLSQWIFYAAQQLSHLFLELDSLPSGELVGLSLTRNLTDNLYMRWAPEEIWRRVASESGET